MHPRTLRPLGSCPKGPRQRPGSIDCTSLSRQRNRRDPSRRPCGRFRPLPPQCNGDPEEPRRRAPARRSPRQEQRAAGHCFGLARDLRVPVCRGEGMTEMPERSRARRARVRCTHTDVRSTNSGMPSRTAEGSAASGGCSLWLLSLAQARESDPRAGSARKTERTRSEKKGAGFWLSPNDERNPMGD